MKKYKTQLKRKEEEIKELNLFYFIKHTFK